MGFRINTNIAAMNAHRNATQTNLGLDKSLNSLSSGLRINKAADDASGMSIADSLRQQAQGLGQAVSNANDGIGVAQTADGALEEYINIANTIRTKSIQAASDGQNLQSRSAIQNDIDRLMEEAQNIATTTSFNGQSLLNGAFQNKSFHIGAYAGETVNISISDTRTANVAANFALAQSTTAIAAQTAAGTPAATRLTVSVTAADGTSKSVDTGDITPASGAMSSSAIAQHVVDAFNAKAQEGGVDIRASRFELSTSTATTPAYGIRLDSGSKFAVTAGDNTGLAVAATALAKTNNFGTIDVTTRESAEKAVIISDYALRDLDKTRADIGSVQNQLESTIRNISVTQVNVQAAESQIRDVDFAAESANFAKLNILAQSGSYAMSQANAVQQNVMRLLQ
ncbi:MAG: flagellin [Sulfurimonas sp.]|nr:flagellin [Sulfurimonas sp.]MDD3834149.1 flagellin [Sulfurimonas sp.]MDY0234222.1 flagellin [Sulfurimonas sp.]